MCTRNRWKSEKQGLECNAWHLKLFLLRENHNPVAAVRRMNQVTGSLCVWKISKKPREHQLAESEGKLLRYGNRWREQAAGVLTMTPIMAPVA